MTLPPATSGGTRPKVTYSYTGVNGVQMVTGISTCRAGSSCAGTANEVKTTFAYDSLQRPTSVTIAAGRSEEHTSELQSLMRISYAVFCLKKKKKNYTSIITQGKHNANKKLCIKT